MSENEKLGPVDLAATLTIGSLTIPVTLTVEAALGSPEALQAAASEVPTGVAEVAEVAETVAVVDTTPLDRVRAEIEAIRNLSDGEAIRAVSPLVTGVYGLADGRRQAAHVLDGVSRQLAAATQADVEQFVDNSDAFVRQFANSADSNDVAVARYIHGRLSAAFKG